MKIPHNHARALQKYRWETIPLQIVKIDQNAHDALMPFLLSERDVREHPDWPQWFPYKLAEPHQRQAMVNHGQTLRRLAERGGLGHRELYHILRDERFRHTGHPGAVSDEVAALYLQELIEGYEPSIEGHQP